MGAIVSWLFLLCGLFFPHLTLGWCWFVGAVPANDTSFDVDVVGAIFAPRLLISYWLYEDDRPVMALLYFLVFLGAVSGESAATQRKRRSS